jgi:glycosyltransferase involved in cell wall biosynthesis
VLIEAGLRGLPAVATDVGYVREIVLDDQTGVIVDREDAQAIALGITRVLDAAHWMGERARQRCLAEFEMKPIVERWRTLLERLVT